ncbi:nucleotidyltransferase family protein [Verrucomicrobiota bacterium sgz303538]
MKALILAAGYATRLYPLTENFPKPLLEVGGRTILDRLLDQVAVIPEVDGVYVVTNSRFASHFDQWKATRRTNVPIEIIDDGSTENDNRLGAIGDIQLAIERCNLRDDLFVAAADNILLFSLEEFAAAFRKGRAPHVCARYLEDLAARQRTGIVVLDEDNRILEFQEKPREPKSTWGVPPLYLYPRETLPRFAEYLAQGGTADAPGNFIEWLSGVEAVYAWKMDGNVVDIGNLASLEAARERFKE